MARPLRLAFAGALYHVTARGNERRSIFLGDEDSDRAVFLDVLGATCERFNWLLHAYCLMTNHYHLLVETPDANLSKGMRQLNGVFTQYVNRTHARVGHLFQGRFKAILVERESYLLELCRYVVLNPVRARMVADPGDWPWSSYRATVAIGRRLARRRRRDGWRPTRCCGRLPKSGMPRSPATGASSPRASAPPAHSLREVPKRQRRAVAKPLAEYAAGWPDRDRAMAEAYRSGAYSMQTIAEYFGVSRMTVSRAVKRDENAAVTCET